MAVSDFIYPLMAIPVRFVRDSDQFTTIAYRWCNGINLVQAENVPAESFDYCFYTKPCLDRCRSVCGGGFADESSFHLVQISRLCYRFHLDRDHGRKLFRFVFFYVDRKKRENYLHGFSLISILRLECITALFQIVSFVALPILYCVIAVTLRRQDKALQCRAVHQKNQRKLRAIKMSVCIVAAFYICFLPARLALIIGRYKIEVSCSFSKVLRFLPFFMLYLSSAINPIICMTFVKSYRLGLKEIFNWRCSKRLTTSNMAETGVKREQITLQGIRRIPWMEENLAFNE
ncbi:hypothetical protein OS493_031851 [Desmophyllum pertusum]|uniref:G-protein coupled receptors family 1 profile domain-containing protein n=1 Tax=Desmophyllum pertusum TaxID=174260 RepID=A0A9W9YBN5_9CNID|nr:hypothetical protein OS493_031851 [Desmophyllum pertusum]